MQRATISWQIRVSIWCFAIGTLLILWTLARISVQQSGTASAPAPQQIAIVPTAAPTDTPEPTATPEPTVEPTLEPPTAIPEPTATELPTATSEPTALPSLGITVDQVVDYYKKAGFQFIETEVYGMPSQTGVHKEYGAIRVSALNKDADKVYEVMALAMSKDNARNADFITSVTSLILPNWEVAQWIKASEKALSDGQKVETSVDGRYISLEMVEAKDSLFAWLIISAGSEPRSTEPLVVPTESSTTTPETIPQPKAYEPIDKTTCPEHALIKGNVVDRGQNKGERIYHAPGSNSYNATHPEYCFASTTEAEAAGFRAANTTPSTTDGFISRDLLGDNWPLTVDEIILDCINQAIIGNVNGVMYAINGTAKQRAEPQGWREIDEIWADDDVGLKKDLSVLITMGEQRCVKE